MIDEKIREAYRTAIEFPAPSMIRDLLDWAVHAEARARMAEFLLEHNHRKCSDPRHKMMLADYRAEVEAELSK